jgi:hypothetical protein
MMRLSDLPDYAPPIETTVLQRLPGGRVEVGFANPDNARETTRVFASMAEARKAALFIALTRDVAAPEDIPRLNRWLAERDFDPLPAGTASIRGTLELRERPVRPGGGEGAAAIETIPEAAEEDDEDDEDEHKGTI